MILVGFFDDFGRDQLKIGEGLHHQSMIEQPTGVDEFERLE